MLRQDTLSTTHGGWAPPAPLDPTACPDTVKKRQIPTAVRNTTLIPIRANLILSLYSLNIVAHQMDAEGKAQNMTADANSTVAHGNSMQVIFASDHKRRSYIVS